MMTKSRDLGNLVSDGASSGVATYANVDALPSTGNTAGDLAYVTTGPNSKPSLYIWNGHGWYKIDDVNTSPTMNDLGSDPVRINANSDSTITITASDVDEDTSLQYKYQVTTGSLPSGADITTTSDVSITENSYVSSNQFKVNIDATTGSFTLTFTVTDGINTSIDTIDIEPPSVVTSGLVLHIDAAHSTSSSSVIYNLVPNTEMSNALVNSPTYVDDGDASHWSFSSNGGTTSNTSYIETDIQRDNTSFTYSAWFRLDAAQFTSGSEKRANLLSTFMSGGNGEWTDLSVDTSQYADFAIDNNSVKIIVSDGDTALSTATWYNLVGTYNSTTGAMKIYRNGSLVESGTQTENENAGTGRGTITGTGSIDGNSTNPIRIAARANSIPTSEQLIGDIALIHTYSRELSSSEVTQNWNAYKDRYGL